MRERASKQPFSRVRSGGGSYDPDEEFIALAKKAPVHFDFNSDVDPWGNTVGEICATLYEVDTSGRAYRLKRYDTKAELLEAMRHAGEVWDAEKLDRVIPAPWKLREAKTLEREAYLEKLTQEVLDRSVALLREGKSFNEVRATLREDFAGGGYGEPGYAGQDWVTGSRGQYGSGFTSGTEYTPVMGGPWSKQLYLAQFLDMHAKAFEAYNHNPFAHQLINLTTMFTLGRGIDHTASNEEVDEIIREFTDRTEFYARLEQIATDLWWSGEHIVEWYDGDPEDGLTDFREIDPSTIWEIVTDPEDFRKIYYAHQQYATPWQQYVTGVPAANQPLTMKYIIRQIPAAQFSHFKINSSAFEKRGRSELFCVLGWLKRHKDLMNARIIKGQLEAAFVWDITLTTGDADVEAANIQLPDPFNPGSTFLHNKSMELKPQSSAIKGNDASPDVDTLTTMIAVGVSTPKEFLGQTSRGARGSTLAGTEPGTKRYETMQQLEMRITYAYFDRVIKNAAQAGTIDLEEVLADARTVKRLATTEGEMPTRDDAQKQMDENEAEAEQKAQQQNEQTMLMAKQQADALAGQNTNGPLINPASKSQPVREAGSLIKSGGGKGKLNPAQKRRIQAIIKSGQIARELIDLSFPSIAQEERSAVLKDLALAEAMEWLPKSVAATIAAKELGLSSYDFQEAWSQIVDESEKGMSIAHVFGQDNKHTPQVVNAQSVQEENQALQPVATQPILNVPQPPVVPGMKQEPNPAAKPGAQGGPPSVPPGQKPNSGDTKVNNKLATPPVNPTTPTPASSDAGKSPFTSAGKNNAKEVASMRSAIYMTLLKEAVKPMLDVKTSLARYILDRDEALKEFEAAVAEISEKK